MVSESLAIADLFPIGGEGDRGKAPPEEVSGKSTIEWWKGLNIRGAFWRERGRERVAKVVGGSFDSAVSDP